MLTLEEIEEGERLLVEYHAVGHESQEVALAYWMIAHADELLASAKAAAWRPIETAPKGATPQNPTKELWILGRNKQGKMRVIRWCMEYPYSEGCWMFAYEPRDYIDGIQTFDPIEWRPLPQEG